MPDATDHLGEARKALNSAEGVDHQAFMRLSAYALAHALIALVEKLAVIAESTRSIGVGLALRSAVDQHAAAVSAFCSCQKPAPRECVNWCAWCNRPIRVDTKEEANAS